MKKVTLFSAACLILSMNCGKMELPPPISDMEIKDIIERVKNLPPEPVEEGEIATLETNMGTIKFKFFPEKAPNTCANFKKLANAKYYDGTHFHRIIKDFMIQGGDILSRDPDSTNDGTGGPGYTIDAEFNVLQHIPGRISMARSRHPNSAGSQFFICHGEAPHLDGQYTVFGEVIEGMEVVNKIAEIKTGPGNQPLEPVVMLKVSVSKE